MSILAERYHRQEIIPGWDQRRLASSTAIVTGVGALGNEVAKNLALAGVGRLILCDPDTVAASNLSRTVLFRPGDVGRAKAEAAAAALRALVPGVVAESRVADLARGVGLGEIRDAAVVVSAVDSIRARMRLLGRCALMGAPLVDGGTHPFGGEVRLRVSPDDACYGCTLSAEERGVSDVPWSCFGVADEAPQPASIATTAIVGSWMSMAALQLLLGSEPAYRMLAVDAVGGRTAPVTADRDLGCPHHRPAEGAARTVPVTSQHTVGALLAAVDPADEPFTWERFSRGGQCGRCGQPAEASQESDPASDAGVSVCPRCGAMVRTRFTQRLRDSDTEATMAGLGIAPEEILPVRSIEGEYRWIRLSR